MFSKHSLMTTRLRGDVIFRAPQNSPLTFTHAGYFRPEVAETACGFTRIQGAAEPLLEVKNKRKLSKSVM